MTEAVASLIQDKGLSTIIRAATHPLGLGSKTSLFSLCPEAV